MKFSAITPAALCLALLGGGPARAGVIYSQPLTGTPADQFGYDSNGPTSLPSSPERTAQQIADNFSLLSATAASGIQWYGSYYSSIAPANITFQIRFFADAAGKPGSLLDQQSVAVTGVPTGFANEDGDRILAYQAALTPLPLAGGTPYWVSILENDPATTTIWAWTFSQDGDGTVGYRTSEAGSWLTVPPSANRHRGMAFTLTDTDAPRPPAVAAVPEPATLTLFGLAAVALGGYLRSRRPTPPAV